MVSTFLEVAKFCVDTAKGIGARKRMLASIKRGLGIEVRHNLSMIDQLKSFDDTEAIRWVVGNLSIVVAESVLLANDYSIDSVFKVANETVDAEIENPSDSVSQLDSLFYVCSKTRELKILIDRPARPTFPGIRWEVRFKNMQKKLKEVLRGVH